MNRKLISTASAVLLVTAIGVTAAIFTRRPATVEAADNTATGTTAAPVGKITVSGQGSVMVKPDIAYIDLGVNTEHADAKTAQANNSAQQTLVINAIKSLGIAEADIKTSGYSMYPKYEYSTNGTSRIVGYTVHNTVTVTVRNIDKVGETIDAAIGAGANIASGIRFSLSDSNAYYAQALKQAIANAKSKSGAIAQALGVAVGNPIEIIENGGSYMPVIYAEADMMKGNAMMDTAMPVQTGELEVTATITAVFAY